MCYTIVAAMSTLGTEPSASQFITMGGSSGLTLLLWSTQVRLKTFKIRAVTFFGLLVLNKDYETTHKDKHHKITFIQD